MRSYNFQKLIVNSIKADKNYCPFTEQHIVWVYEKSDTQTRDRIDQIFMALCGRSLRQFIEHQEYVSSPIDVRNKRRRYK
jgi:hypothetical protein